MAETTGFGGYFRQTRVALGLTLSEFCQQNGFDKANVSRIERGLSPAPKGQKILQGYAKALRLKPSTPQWAQFMNLAVAERVPQELLATPRRGHGHRNWVRAKHLEDWAGTQEARFLLPQLVRRLIRATGEGVRLEAPSGEQVQRPGWDGFVEASGDAEYVPIGISVWEMGVDKKPEGKAEADWVKRQKSPGVTKKVSTFVFVTPRGWQKKSQWVGAKTKPKIWKGVRVYDSASLEEWLECAPAVDIWLARQIGLCPVGVADVDDCWKNLAAVTEPSFGPDVYLASREREVDEFAKLIAAAPDTITVESRSPTEALDFVIAASRREKLSELFAARALVVETRDAWRTFAGGDARLILIVHPALAIEGELVAEAVRNGHHVILCTDATTGVQHNRIELPRVAGFELQEALKSQGVSHTRAEELATSAGGSITVLKRRAARHPGTVHPLWSREPERSLVVPLLLTGGWADTSEGDRLAVERLADTPYRDVAILAERWSSGRGSDPMMNQTPGRWSLVSRDDSWVLVSDAITDAALRRFEPVALEVLGEPDPACDLPGRDRWQANLVGKTRAYSQVLRAGLAESLALLGSRPPKQKHLATDPRGLAFRVVTKLLDGKNWKEWASLSSELPLLAEAAPDAFLSALEKDLANKSEVVKLFEDSGDIMFGPSHHVGVLWSLEGLAWDGKYLPQVSRLLARLREAMPGDNRGNSPMQTLEQVFLPWLPQTLAPVEERVKNLEVIAKRFPDCGWKLLIELLPKPHGASSYNRRPAFRDWALKWSRNVSRKDYTFQVEACANMMLEIAGTQAPRLKEVIDVFESLPPVSRSRLIERLNSIEPETLGTGDQRMLTEAVRQKVNRHRRFAHTDWAMKGPVLEELDGVRRHLEPEDPISQNAWLFGEYWKVRDQVEKDDDGGKDPDELLREFRTRALEVIRTRSGWEGILELAHTATHPEEVGQLLGELGVPGDDPRVLPALLTDERKSLNSFARGYSFGRWSKQRWSWVNGLSTESWTDQQFMTLALALLPERDLWDLIEKRGAKLSELYWKSVDRYCYSKDANDISRFCTSLLRVSRTYIAIRQLAMARHRDVAVEPALTIAVLEAEKKSTVTGGESVGLGEGGHDVQMLIGELQSLVRENDPRVDSRKVASLEWKYLELLDGHPTTPEMLHTLLHDEPAFFVDLLKLCFRRADEVEQERPDLSEVDQARARQAYRLLMSWQRVPGSLPDGTVDGEALLAWVRSAQELAEKESRREVGDLKIGNVFAFAPEELSDHTWPCVPVRDLMEELGTESLMDGFEIGIFNSRGAQRRGLVDGGMPERELVAKYQALADAVKIEWPKVAASLRRVADQYDSEARRWDTDVL